MSPSGDGWFGRPILRPAKEPPLPQIQHPAGHPQNLAELHFPEAIQIVDLYHTREHVSDLCKILFAPDVDEVVKYRIRWWDYLDEGNVERIARTSSRSVPSQRPRRG